MRTKLSYLIVRVCCVSTSKRSQRSSFHLLDTSVQWSSILKITEKNKTFSKSWTIFALHSLLEVNIHGQSWPFSAAELTTYRRVDQLLRWAHKSDLMTVILPRVIYCLWCNHHNGLRLVCHLESRKKSTLAEIWTQDPDHNLKWNLPSKWGMQLKADWGMQHKVDCRGMHHKADWGKQHNLGQLPRPSKNL